MRRIKKTPLGIAALSKPVLQAEGALDWSKHVTPTTLTVFQEQDDWTQVQSLKRSVGEETQTTLSPDKEGSWKKIKGSLESQTADPSVSSTLAFDAEDQKAFGALPMEEDKVIVQCKGCDRPMLASSFSEHLQVCEKQPQGKTIKAGKTSDKKSQKKGIKGVQGEKKKKEKQKKATPKQKAPLDLDKQCGVIQGPNNTPCTRSLTCKSHSMGAKRAVANRSQPYDVLLAAYQKKSIGRPQTGPAMAGPNPTTVPPIKLPQTRPLTATTSTTAIATTEPAVPDEHYVDSDEEVENVMDGIRHSYPAPMASKPFYFVKRRRQCFRLRDILLDAITPKATTSNTSLASSVIAPPTKPSHPMHPSLGSASNTSFPFTPGPSGMSHSPSPNTYSIDTWNTSTSSYL
ncbi:SCA7, zinc-binding domain-containing protein [Phycomyces nitens]|nr:SCA7, zinc-binding domain-containing protein [Phycomyces nitens]